MKKVYANSDTYDMSAINLSTTGFMLSVRSMCVGVFTYETEQHRRTVFGSIRCAVEQACSFGPGRSFFLFSSSSWSFARCALVNDSVTPDMCIGARTCVCV